MVRGELYSHTKYVLYHPRLWPRCEPCSSEVFTVPGYYLVGFNNDYRLVF